MSGIVQVYVDIFGYSEVIDSKHKFITQLKVDIILN